MCATLPRSSSSSDDERARVPFALIGVLLLVTSSAYAAGIAGQGLVTEDRSVERAVERVETDTTAALRAAARDAAYESAARPVTKPPEAGSNGGATRSTNAVRSGSAFEDALRIRLALAADESLAPVEAEVGGITATASIQRSREPGSEGGLTAARESVTVESVANGTAMAVTFENVTTSATRNGRTVAERTRDRTVVVAVPTLAAHERTERFEERLNRGPVEGPGLGRQLTASLYPMTWARGYAQYGGAPVENVLGNRHVELSTNAGIVRVQRGVFGASDPDARGGVAAATARTGLADVLEPTGVREEAWTDAVLDTPTPATATEGDGFDAARSHDEETASVEVGHAADVAAVSVHEDLDSIVRGSYRVEAFLETETIRIAGGDAPNPTPPGDGNGWRRVNKSVEETVRVVGGDGVPNGSPTGTVEPGVETDFGTASREVVVERVATVTWERVDVSREGVDAADPFGVRRGTRGTTADQTKTRESSTNRYRVTVEVSGAYAPRDGAPARPTATFGAGVESEDGDLAATPAAARSDFGVDTVESVDRIARETVTDGDLKRSTVVHGRPSDTEMNRIASDINDFRGVVSDVEADLSMEEAAAGEAEPHAELADALRERRTTLAGAPETYDGAADRARIAARIAYLDAVIEELERTADDERAASDAFVERIEDAIDGPSVSEIIASREAARDGKRRQIGDDGPGRAVTFVPNGSPGYLPRTVVDGGDVAAVEGATRPLDTRNLNYVTVPYGSVSSGVIDRILGTGDTVRIGVAGRALLSTNDALTERDDSNLESDRDALAERVTESRRNVDRALVEALGEATSLSKSERAAAVRSAAAEYDSPGTRAVAVGDGDYADEVAENAARFGSLSAREEAALAARLRVALRTAAGRDAVRVPTRLVDGPTRVVREEIRDRAEGAVEDGAKRVGDRAAERWAPKPARAVGAGLPIAPVPGYWAATVNAWRVEVRGEYPRFALTADVGTPGRSFEYVRENATVTTTVDDERVRLGSTEPVAFETETIVVVAVPAGAPGVGDVDGTRNETSTGW